MFDLESHLREWRQEIEATLAFSSEEIDELEDHLRLSFDAKLKEGLAPEIAWPRSLGCLGAASALAGEFAKDKLMPALVRLLVSWWRPACLLVLFGAIFMFSYFMPMVGNEQVPASRAQGFWELTWFSLLVTLIFLPDRAQKNAVLVGLGNAFCLIPILHILFYNPLTEKMIGAGWSRMAASFGWLAISLGLIGLVFVNVWWWKRNAAMGNKFSMMLAVTGALVLVLTFSPFVGEWVGNLSIREIYQMPTVSQVTYAGHTRDMFLQWKFVEVLVNSVLYITNILPFALALLICVEVLMFQGSLRNKAIKAISQDDLFPSLSALPWIMALAGSGFCWVLGHLIEPNFSEQVRQVERSISPGLSSYGGLEITILFSAFLFFVCGYELTKRLARASQIRPFYAAMVVVIEGGVALALFLLPRLLEMIAIKPTPTQPSPLSAQPEWLSWVLGLAIVVMALGQVFFIAKKYRHRACQTSLWRFDGGNLIQLGLLLGLIFACCGLILYMIAIVMAFESTSVIGAMIAWGNSIKDPAANHFYPQMYGTPDHLTFWVESGITYLSFCLTAGLGVVMVLSALEFIRFNSFRLYKMRKLRQGAAEALALNE